MRLRLPAPLVTVHSSSTMKIIWKFPVQITAHFVVPMPEGAQVLSVHMQGHEPQMWALVDSAAPTVDREFHILGTGIPWAGPLGRFVGTVLTHGGAGAWHLFEAQS